MVENAEVLNPEDIRRVQKLVLNNSYERRKHGVPQTSVELTDMSSVIATLDDSGQQDIPWFKRLKVSADVSTTDPVPALDLVLPFIQELLLRGRESFSLRTGPDKDAIVVRFTLKEPPLPSQKIGENTVRGIRDSIF